MSSSRDVVLGRVRAALGQPITAEGAAVPARSASGPPLTRDYQRSSPLAPGSPALLDLFQERLLDYRAAVRRTSASGLSATVAAVLAEMLPAGARVVLPPGLPLHDVAETVVDDGTLDAGTLDALDGVVTACAVAVAETGTIVLDASPDQGRRAITLVPDLHVCVVRAEQVVGSITEALERLSPQGPLTWISGPSATSDIELDRVEGVHGPRRLIAVLVTD